MAEVKIVVKKGKRSDCMAEVGTMQGDRFVPMGHAGPTERHVEDRVRGMKDQLERAGHHVNVKEMREG